MHRKLHQGTSQCNCWKQKHRKKSWKAISEIAIDHRALKGAGEQPSSRLRGASYGLRKQGPERPLLRLWLKHPHVGWACFRVTWLWGKYGKSILVCYCRNYGRWLFLHRIDENQGEKSQKQRKVHEQGDVLTEKKCICWYLWFCMNVSGYLYEGIKK